MLSLGRTPFQFQTYRTPWTTCEVRSTILQWTCSVVTGSFPYQTVPKTGLLSAQKRGLFQFTRMPFGLSGAPGSFCRVMSISQRDLLWKICLCYLDDIVIYARTPEELLERFRIVLDRLREVGLKVKPSKCELFKKRSSFWAIWSAPMALIPCPRNWRQSEIGRHLTACGT